MTAKLTEIAIGKLDVAGILEMESATETFAEGKQWIEESDASKLEIDLAQVTDVDSSSLAILIGWLHECNALGKVVKFMNMPSKMRDIARVSGLDTVIDIDL